MALRAGYYGVKRALKNKLSEIARTWDDTVNQLTISKIDWASYAKTGVHNILDPDFNAPSFSGVDDIVTLNNGILTLNGTRASSANYAIKDRKTGAKVIYLPKGTYTFYALGVDWENGAQVGTTYNNTFVSIAQSGSDKDRVTFTVDDNTQSDYKLSDGSVLIGLYVKILAGTYSDKIIKPMLCLGNDPIDTYEPYSMTNQALTASAVDQKTAINAIITAATNAADFAAFKTAMGAITPVTRSLSTVAAPEEIVKDEIEEPIVEKKTTRKKSTANAETNKEV